MVENKNYIVFNLKKDKIISYTASKLHTGHPTILNVWTHAENVLNEYKKVKNIRKKYKYIIKLSIKKL